MYLNIQGIFKSREEGRFWVTKCIGWCHNHGMKRNARLWQYFERCAFCIVLLFLWKVVYQWNKKAENETLSNIIWNQGIPKPRWYKERRWLMRYGFNMLISYKVDVWRLFLCILCHFPLLFVFIWSIFHSGNNKEKGACIWLENNKRK